MKTALKYVGLTIQYAFIFAIKFLQLLLKIAFRSNRVRKMQQERNRKELDKIYWENNFDGTFHPDNPNNPVKRFKGW